MNRQLLDPLFDPYELGGTSLELDVQESNFPGDLLEFQTLAEHQDLQFADTTPFSSLDAVPPASQGDGVCAVPLNPGGQTQDLQHKFRAMLTGIPDIDFEHEQLMLQLERIYHSDRLETARADIDKFIGAWNVHHLHEEQHMRSKHYPDLAAHAEQHARLLDGYQFVRNEAMHSEVDQESLKAYVEIVAKLVADHIARVDMLYVRWGNV